MLLSVEQAFVGREEIRASLKTPAWEATRRGDHRSQNSPIVQFVTKPTQAFSQTQSGQYV